MQGTTSCVALRQPWTLEEQPMMEQGRDEGGSLPCPERSLWVREGGGCPSPSPEEEVTQTTTTTPAVELRFRSRGTRSGRRSFLFGSGSGSGGKKKNSDGPAAAPMNDDDDDDDEALVIAAILGGVALALACACAGIVYMRKKRTRRHIVEAHQEIRGNVVQRPGLMPQYYQGSPWRSHRGKGKGGGKYGHYF